MATKLTRTLSRKIERRYSVKAVSQAFGDVEAILRNGTTNTTTADPAQLLESWVSKMDDQFSTSGGFSNPDCPHAFLSLLESPFFSANLNTVVDYLSSKLEQRVIRRVTWIFHLLVLGAQSLYPNLYALLLDTVPVVSRLKTYTTRAYDLPLKFPALTLLTHLCNQMVLSESDFALLDDSFIAYLLYTVEKSSYSDEQCNEAASQLLVAIHKQCRLRLPSRDSWGESPNNTPLPNWSRNSSPVSSDSPLLVPTSIGLKQRCTSTSGITPNASVSKLVFNLGREQGNCTAFVANLIFMLNREQEPTAVLSLLDLITSIVTTPATFTLFFTNDLKVLVDVIIRELYNLPADAEALRLAYLRLLPPIVLNTQYLKFRHKAAHLASLLRNLASRESLALVSSEVGKQAIQTARVCEEPLAYGPLV
ncbi:pre-rRNA processing [Dispira simplex]|nr:pre-rRNA processing [Dispira simplex]